MSMKVTLEQLIRAAGELPPMPQAAQKALQLIRDPEVNMGEVAAVLAVDQVLSGLVLRLANSAFYGLPGRVVTVHQAVMVLGSNAVRDLLLASTVAGYLSRPLPGYALPGGALWRHALGVAIGARWIFEKRRWKGTDEVYYAGLLCDIGKLPFEKLLRGVQAEAGDWLHGSFLEMERQHFGIDHALLGAEIGRRWHLPDELITAIAHHHQPAEAPQHQKMVAAVHVADAAMMMLGVGVGVDGLRYVLDGVALELLGFEESEMEDLIRQVTDQIYLAELFLSDQAPGW